MPLQLSIVSEHSEILGDDAIREFREGGGTIGRSLQNDWILPDSDKYISGRHATVDYKGGIYYLLDTSTNGVYVNEEIEPIGKGNPRRLFNGDRLRMGEFEIEVKLDSGESLELPAPPPSLVPDNVEQLVDEVTLRTGVKLLDEEEITGDEEFQSALFGASNDPVEEPAVEEPKDRMEPPSIEDSIRESLEKLDRIASKGIEVGPEDLFDSFLDGLGISRAELHPSIDKAEVLQNAGYVMREFVAGTINLLSSRANLKNTFHLDQTSVLPRHNNPLKLSHSPSDLIKQLLVGKDGEYLAARDAVREVCRDLLFHQNAFLDAMNSAFIEFADRFDPDELVDGFKRALSSNLFTKYLEKSKYWDLYCDLYPIMTEKGGGRFPQMFGEEFVKAYERQIAEYQRLERVDGGDAIVKQLTAPQGEDAPVLKDTVKLEPGARLPQLPAENDDDLLDDEQINA